MCVSRISVECLRVARESTGNRARDVNELMLVESGRRNELCMETVLPFAVHFLLVQTTKSIVCRRHTQMLVSNRNLSGAPTGLVVLGRLPPAPPLMNLRKNRISLNSSPLFSNHHFGAQKPSLCVPPRR